MTERRGRKSKEEEAQEYLRSLGLDPEAILAGHGSVEMPDDQTMVDEFKKAMYLQMTKGELKNTSLVQALKALSVLAEASKGDRKTDTPERRIDDVLADAGLPAERRREIAEREIERLKSATAALEVVLGGIE